MQESKQKKYVAKKQEQVNKLEARVAQMQQSMEQCAAQMAEPMEDDVGAADKARLHALQVCPPFESLFSCQMGDG